MHDPVHDWTEPFQVHEVEVIVADREDIIRAAAVSTLTRFGFAHVHEAEGDDEVLQKLHDVLQSPRFVTWEGQQCSLPIIIIVNQHLLDTLNFGAIRDILSDSPQQDRQDLFVICTSARSDVKGGSVNKYHCFVPKNFPSLKLEYSWRLCQAWWRDGRGHSCGELPRPVSEASAAAAAAAPPLQRPSLLPAVARAGDLAEHHAALVATAVRLSPTHQMPTTPLPFTTTRGDGKTVSNLGPPPSLFEDIETTCMVGRGSFGRVFRARWHLSVVALKVVECFEEEKNEIMPFEGQLACSLSHPHLVQTFMYSMRDIAGISCHLKGYELWIVQEWCGLGTLWQKISRNQIIPRGGFQEVTEVSIEIASGAHYLHCREIIHGDLTANNVLLVERNCPKGYICKVSDFGLARVLEKGKSEINTATIGTVAYMPPELFQRTGGVLTKKVDVYSFGIVLWQLCTGCIPYVGKQPTQVVVMVSQGAVLEMPGHVPDQLSRIYKATVSRQPESRPKFAKMIQDFLKIVKADEDLQRVYDKAAKGEKAGKPCREPSPLFR